MADLSMKAISLFLRSVDKYHIYNTRVLKQKCSSLSNPFVPWQRYSSLHQLQSLKCYNHHYKQLYYNHCFKCPCQEASQFHHNGQSHMSTVPHSPEPESPHKIQSRQSNGFKQEQMTEELRSEKQTDEYDEEDKDKILYRGHIPVLVRETLQAMCPRENHVIVDMTFGAGGHASHIMKSTSDLTYIASDRDPVACQRAVEFSSDFREGQVIPILSKFSELGSHLLKLNIAPGSVDAFLMDLGPSSLQFDTAERGFSLSRDGPLDMRMDGGRIPDAPTAADVVNNLDPADISQILKRYGEESHATKIAHAIVEARYAFGNFSRTSQLAAVIKAVFESSFRHDKLHRHAHVATKTFQALRIFVNDELNEIHNGLEVARRFLKTGGRCVAISFHSLEDRIVKRHFHDIDVDERPNVPARYHIRNTNVSCDVNSVKENYLSRSWQPLSRKVIEATEEEVRRNPRARSAKLRAAVKTKNS